MFDVVAKGFRDVKNRFQGKRELTEENISEALRDIRMSLLEADVNYRIAKRFIKRVKEKAVGEVVKIKAGTSDIKVSPGDHFIKICHDELENLMGPVDTKLIFENPRIGPTKIMMVGLQGAGKTTTTGKLAKYIRDTYKKKPLLVAADVYRPAAVDQLRVLGEQLDMPVFYDAEGDPPDICERAVEEAKKTGRDVVLFDTAGRLAVDDLLMLELEEIVNRTNPGNIFLVADAMIGQDAVNTAKEFNARLELDGFIMTKLDGDARGGAALSIKEVTGKPIKFVGLGEGMDALEEFRPDGFANRILGFGDVVGLMHKFERQISEDEQQVAEESAMRMLQGEFTYDDFLAQIEQLKKLGSMTEIMEMMPFFGGQLPEGADISDAELVKVKAMIQSMTRNERNHPDLLKGSTTRWRRIARGSGRTEKDVQELIQKFNLMRGMLQQIGQGMGGGLLSNLPGLKQLNQLRAMKNMDMGGLFELLGGGGMPGMPGGGGGGGGGMPGLPGMGMPGMPGLPGMPGMPGGSIPGLPEGFNPKPGFRTKSSKSGSKSKRAKNRDKRRRRRNKKK
ncbi:MAG: signal recognition particle protein [Myxococcales bacterium]|nr:signal recognition particle protein [Myxococcales bacterium]